MAAQQLQVGIELAQKAILLDTNHQYREAIPEYNSAIAFFSEVLQDPNCSEQKKNIVSQKIQEYHARVLLLLEAIGENSEQTDAQKQAPTEPQQSQQQQHQPQPQPQHQPQFQPQQSHHQVEQPTSDQSQSHFQQQQFQTQQSFQPPIQQNFQQPQQSQPYFDPNSRSIPYGQPYAPQQQPQPQPQQTVLAYLPSPTGLLPITADLALQYMLDPLLIEYATKHPKNIPNLPASLTLAEKAKEADVKQMYQQAVDLYAEALERFRVAVAVEQNPAIHTTLMTTINAYQDRLERIKAMFQLQPRSLIGLPTQTVSPPAMSSHVSAPARSETVSTLPQPPQQIKNANGEITESTSGGPITVKKSMKKLAGLRAGTIALEATIKTNIIKAGDQVSIAVFVDNRTSSIVNCMKVKFVRVSGKVGKDSKKMILSRQEYYQGSIFPLQAENSYRGDVLFPIPRDQQLLIPHTPCTFYFVVEADLPMTKNLKAKIPLILTQ